MKMACIKVMHAIFSFRFQVSSHKSKRLTSHVLHLTSYILHLTS